MITNTTARALADALITYGGCTCEYARNTAGVPVWSGVPLVRTRTKKCGMCRALELYALESAPHECAHVMLPTVRCSRCLEELRP